MLRAVSTVVTCVACSLKAPRMGSRDRPSEPWATDAKEFLRKKLIGREVAVKMVRWLALHGKVSCMGAEVSRNRLGCL